jgi:hypothetical protein
VVLAVWTRRDATVTSLASRAGVVALALLGAGSLVAPAARQGPGRPVNEWRATLIGAASRYEVLYGEPITMSVDTLLDGEPVPPNRAIRTFGTFVARHVAHPEESLGENPRRPSAAASLAGYGVCGLREPHRCLQIQPVPEVAEAMDTIAFSVSGRRATVVGAFMSTEGAGPGSQQLQGAFSNLGPLAIWSFEVEDADRAKRRTAGREIGLRRLVAEAGALDGLTLRVVGRFRGRNLFGDLPEWSRRAPSDWVIQDQGVAIWVTGMEPKGEGWALDPDARSDADRWVEVVGEPTADGVIYLRAREVWLTTAPRAEAGEGPR